MRLRAALVFVIVGLTLLVPLPLVGSARAADVPLTIDGPRTTTVSWNAPFTVSGTGPPGATVVIHYLKSDPIEYVDRPVTVGSDGRWSRVAVLAVNYDVSASLDSTFTGYVTFSAAQAVGAAPRLDQGAATYVPYPSYFTVSGQANPGSTVQVHYHRAGTAPTDYSIVRTVQVDGRGRWHRDADIATDYRLFVTAAVGGAASPTVLFSGVPHLTTEPVTDGFRGMTTNVYGYATPGSTVLFHYHRQGTPATDYSIVRAVLAGPDGWFHRSLTLDVDYRLFLSKSDGSHPTPALLIAAKPSELGVTKTTPANVALASVATAIDVTPRQVDLHPTFAPDRFTSTPRPGYYAVAVQICVKTVGVHAWNVHPYYFDLVTDDLGSYGGGRDDTLRLTSGPPFEGVIVAPGQSYCGWAAFQVRNGSHFYGLQLYADSGVDSTVAWEIVP